MSILNTWLAHFTISTKIVALVALLLVSLAATGAVGGLAMKRIGDEIVEIAEYDLPLTERVQQTALHQLEQAVLFERALRLAEAAANDRLGAAEQRFDATRAAFMELSGKVDAEIAEAIEALDAALEHASAGAAAEWRDLRQRFVAARELHSGFEEHALSVLDQVSTGKRAGLAEQLSQVESEEAALIEELESMTAELMSFTRQAALTAEHDEKIALAVMIALAAGTLLLGALASWVLVRAITHPLGRVIEALSALGNGDTSREVPVVGRDEVARLAEGYGIFREKVIETERLRAEQEEAERRAEEEKRRAMHELADRFEQRVAGVIETVSGATTELQATAQQLAAAVEETSSQSTAVAAAAEQASGNVQTVAAAAEQLSAAIKEVSQQVGEAARRSGAAAESGSGAQAELDALSGAIEKINGVVASINEVAEQTNLLALNATIEAARAGEAGKGFAVVASEVKNLANQTRKMTDTVSAQIGSVIESSGRAVAGMKDILAQINEIDGTATAVASAVEEQSAATSEISRNAQEASTGTSEVSRNISGVQSAANETGEASANLKKAADELAQQSSFLKSEVESFLSEVRAA